MNMEQPMSMELSSSQPTCLPAGDAQTAQQGCRIRAAVPEEVYNSQILLRDPSSLKSMQCSICNFMVSKNPL